jgi:hypothetical protein
MPYDKVTDARRGVQDEQSRAREIADEQMRRVGYKRSPGFDPAPRARTPHVAEAERLPPSPPLDLSKAGDPKTKRRSFGVNQ